MLHAAHRWICGAWTLLAWMAGQPLRRAIPVSLSLNLGLGIGLGLACAHLQGGEAEDETATAERTTPTMSTQGVRLKDLCEILGVRDNQLIGFGVVVGLSGTGDKTPATVRMLKQMLSKFHLAFSESDLLSKNVAMVAVTADLPAFSRSGSRLFTQVSCVGDATSLKGGILLQTPLYAADKFDYAVAQGTVSVGGYGNAGPAFNPPVSEHRNVETEATLASGALVEKEVPVSMLMFGNRLRLVLRESDFTTASRVARVLGEAFGASRVSAEDASVISLGFPTNPSEQDLVDTIAKLQQLRVEPDIKARVVINERTGTVVAGNQVRISAVAVSHAGLSLRIAPLRSSHPDPLDHTKDIIGISWVDPLTKLKYDSPPAGTRPSSIPGTMTIIEGASVDDIANALNALGARPRDLVAIFQAIQRAGALHAELVLM